MVEHYNDRRLLETLYPNLPFHEFAEKKPLPRREGESIKWRQWHVLKKGRLLAESGAGPGTSISARLVSAKLILLGDHGKITTYLDLISVNPVVQGAIDLFGHAGAETLNFMISRMLLLRQTSISATLEVSSSYAYLGERNQLSCTLAVSNSMYEAPAWLIRYPDSRAHDISMAMGGVSATPLSPGKIRSFTLKLRVKHAQPFDGQWYYCFIHPDITNQLRAHSAFRDIVKYTPEMVKRVVRGEVGELEKVRFIETTTVPWCAVSSSTKHSAHGYGRYYFSFLFGKGAYGVTELEGGVKVIVKNPGPQDTSNPLNLYSTVGYRIIGTAKILNPSTCLWMVHGKPAETG